jgi:hypothetical protein
MEGAENPGFVKDQHTQVSSVIMFSVCGFTCVKTVNVNLHTFVPVRDLV